MLSRYPRNMRAKRNLMILGGIWFISLFPAGHAVSQQQSGQQLTFSVRKPSGEQYSPKSHSIIGSKRAVKQSEESLATFLRRNGVQFSGSAASLFYTLNPDISDFEDVPPGGEVNVPTVIGDFEIHDAFNQGFWIYISGDTALKNQLVSDISKLNQVRLPFVAMDASAFGSAEKKANLTRLFVQGSDYLRDVRVLVQEDTQPFTTEALQQYQDDADALLIAAQNTLQSNRVSDADADIILLTSKDLTTKARGLNGSKSPGNVARNPQATMTVTIVPEDNTRTSLIRICYSLAALFEKRNQCSNTVGPHAKLTLPVADYLVWAAMDENSPPLSKPRPVPLENQGAEVSVEIVLLE